ncbi:hypothetical protein MASR2M48_29090 [Spirochaetota bacterium]
MGLGTSDTASSLAFVIIPPGNIAKNIADIRMRLWTLRGAASARAYFDFPVLAWMGSPIDGADLGRYSVSYNNATGTSRTGTA